LVTTQDNWQDYVHFRSSLEWNWAHSLFQSQQLHCGTQLHTLRLTESKVITGGVDNQILIWDRYKRACEKRLSGHRSGILSLATSSTLIASGSADWKIKLWNLNNGVCMNTLSGHVEPVSSVVLTKCHLLSSSYDRTVKVWDLETGMCLQNFRHARDVLAISSDGKMIASGSSDKIVYELSLEDGLPVRSLRGHTGSVWAVHIDERGTISGSSDKTIRVWKDGTIRQTLTGHNNSVRCLKVQGKWLVSGSSDHTVKLWSPLSGAASRTLHHKGEVVAVDLDLTTIVSGDTYGRVMFRSFNNRRLVAF